MADVVVVVPARDEEAKIGRCVASIRRALRAATVSGAARRTAVVVVAHRCSDRTAARADAGLAGVRHLVLADDISTTVGEARAGGVAAALGLLGTGADEAGTWVLSTDADSVVPVDWVEMIMTYAGRGAQAVVGMTELVDAAWTDPAAAARYRMIIARGLRGEEHDHVYGANLAVRADAYRAVGGFRGVPVGEDHAIVDQLVAGGHVVARPREIVVRTSGRRVGRAQGGLADLIATLDAAADVSALAG